MTYTYGIAGDWHGNLPWAIKSLGEFHSAGITEALHLGDFGLFGDDDGIEFILTVNEMCAKYGITLLVTLGNHDNWVMFDAFVAIEDGQYDGWLHNPLFPNVLYAPRGHRWEREGVSFVSLGGANSIDRYGRVEGINWWAGEQISYGDIYQTRAGGYADVFLAHDCPQGVNLFDTHRSDDKWSAEAVEYAQHSRVATRQAVDGVKPAMYFHGHYHHYLDQVTTLTDEDDVSYDLRTIGMDKDDCDNNLGLLELPSMKFTILK